jgi:iron complex outermembrane receptor protein
VTTFRSSLFSSASASVVALVLASSSAPAQQALPDVDVVTQAPAAGTPGAGGQPGNPPPYRDPKGQTVTTVDSSNFKTSPLFTIGDLLDYSPGVTVTQGNGPRDVGISIRGSNAANAFAIRNIVLLEDGFPVTTADGGNSRTDITDPHAYGAIDVMRGPSSAMFGNYAIGGAIDFRMRTGAEIDGYEIGSEFGGFGYLNNYFIAGKKVGDFDLSLFASDVRGDGYVFHTAYDIPTVNFLGTWSPTGADRFTLKVLHNDVDTQMAVRLSQSQFYTNPFQKGCVTTTSAPGCAAVAGAPLPANGISGALAGPQSSDQLGLHRDNTRDIVGLRYEHDFDASTTWRTQFAIDDTYNWQPTVPNQQTQGPTDGFNFDTGITSRLPIFGFAATHYLDFFYDNVHAHTNSYYDVPNTYGNGALGADATRVIGTQSDTGVKAREEIALTNHLTAVVGVSSTLTALDGSSEALTGVVAGKVVILPSPTLITASRSMWDTSPEASFIYRFNPDWQARVRYGTAFGTPYYSQLFVTPAGVAGDNTHLKTQTDQGIDAGLDWTPAGAKLSASATVFNEWFQNEQLTQVATNGVAYTANVPDSIHRGLEAAIEYRPFDGWRLAGVYTLEDQYFTKFMDTIGPATGQPAGTLTINRAGNKIPDVPLNQLTARLGYDQPYGALKGLGGYAEYVYRGAYTMDNANLTNAPAAGLVNLNLHYTRDFTDSYIKSVSLFFGVNNVFDKVYIASQAGAISDTVTGGKQSSAAVLYNSGSIVAGAPRTFLGGLKVSF